MGLIDGGGEIALEGCMVSAARCARRSGRSASIERSVRLRCASKACWRTSGKTVAATCARIAGDDLEIGQIVARRQNAARSTTTGRLRKRASSVSTVRKASTTRGGKSFAEHDAVDVARIEMLCGGLDAERADHAHALAERDRERGIGAAAADQEHGRIARLDRYPKRHAPAAPAGASRSRAASGCEARH